MPDVNDILWHFFGRMLMFVEVGAGDCQDLAVVREAETGDARMVLVKLAESFLILSIPNIDQTCKKRIRQSFKQFFD